MVDLRRHLTGINILLGGVLTVALALFGLWLLTLPPAMPSYAEVRQTYRPSEAWLRDREGRLLDAERVDFQVRRLAWTDLDAIAPVLRETVVAAEDRRFAGHGGVDWWALGGSVRDRLSGKRPRGASTLTMQLAAFLAPELARPGARSWRDKLRQMRAAQVLEQGWSKDQILEAYFNLSGFRGEAQGVGAAALTLFGKAPSALSPDDALLMAALLPSPQASAAEVARRACAIGRRSDCLSLQSAAVAMLGPARRLALDPGLAPHLAAKLLREPGVTVMTTLDANTQRIAAMALTRQLRGLGPSRARDGAVVVVDNRSGDVLAYVGGVGGSSTAASVDGADAYRQAGSTLKPFLYAQAMEKGWFTPASIIDDSPVQLDTASGLYVPQNYDRSFKGLVSARTALAGSLNVPAVRTLLLTGVEPFRDRLVSSGYRGLTEDGDYYGFSLALGSAEVTLLEQANAYRTLANGGHFTPLRIKADDPAAAARAVFTPQAAFMVADMMADPGARAVTFGLDSALRLPFWAAVKTGTSKAMRDNWCIGFSDRFTVAVWVGNLEGDPMVDVSGTSGAAPVWREIMLTLHRDRPGRSPAPPPGLVRQRISFARGVEPARMEWFLKGTAQPMLAAAPPEARRPRIVDPVPGTVYAIDPDIPMDRQRVRIATKGATLGHRLLLDRRDLGSADGQPLVLVGPGEHRLLLVDLSGRAVDRVLFSVR
ncbi:penicillin-binding protein 1C [Sphingomonas sp. DBB INV C78]|uniref:penicillin-binding protein 1C n=1 Tax=Sphingomonas sp. DBB INV C78 TaxID=3349434 RepID=UPI0036D22632